MDRGWAPFVFHIHIYVYTWMTWSLLVPSRSYREARLKFQYESSLRYALNHLHTRFTFHSIIELVLTSWVPCTAKIYPIIYDTTKVGTYIESFIEIVAYGWLGVCVCVYIYVDTNHTPNLGGPTMNSHESACFYWVWEKNGRFHFICGQGTRGRLWIYMIWDTHLVWKD